MNYFTLKAINFKCNNSYDKHKDYKLFRKQLVLFISSKSITNRIRFFSYKKRHVAYVPTSSRMDAHVFRSYNIHLILSLLLSDLFTAVSGRHIQAFADADPNNLIALRLSNSWRFQHHFSC